MPEDDPIERLPKLFNIMRDAYRTLELEVFRLKKKASTMSGGLNPHDARQLIAYVKSLTDLSKEERDLIKALKDVDPARVKKLAEKLVNNPKEQLSGPVQEANEEQEAANDPGVPARVRYVVRKAGAPSGGTSEGGSGAQ